VNRPIVDIYTTIPVSPRSWYTAVYRDGTKYRETAQLSIASIVDTVQLVSISI